MMTILMMTMNGDDINDEDNSYFVNSCSMPGRVIIPSTWVILSLHCGKPKGEILLVLLTLLFYGLEN